MKNKLLLFCICISCFSCREKGNSNESSIDLDDVTQVSVTDFFDSVDVVQLETTDSCLIAKIDKVIYFNNKYYISDERQQILFCFDSVGKYLFKIDNKGPGPEEYTYISDFNIDTCNSQIFILEPFGHLLAFDMDGRFISKTLLPKEIVAYNKVYPIDKDNMIFISANKYNVIFYSKVNNSITDKKYLIEDVGTTYSTYIYNNSVYYSVDPTNDVVNLLDSTIFTWDFGKKNNTAKQIDNFRKYLKSKPRGTSRDIVTEGMLNYQFGYNYESSRYRICLLYMGNYKLCYIFYDKKAKKVHVFDNIKEKFNFLVPDFSGESLIMYDRGLKEHPFINTSYYNLDMLSERQKKIIRAHDSTEDHNPFIIKYNLKQ